MSSQNKPFVIAGAQLRCGMDISENLTAIKGFFQQAAAHGVDLLVFPECALSGYAPAEIPTETDFAYNQNNLGEALKSVREMAQQSQIAAVIGTAWKENETWLNRAVVIDSRGSIISWFDKLHLMPGDRHYFQPGRWQSPCELSGIRLGVGICYDLRFPEIWRRFTVEGADLLVNPLAAYGGAEWKRPVMQAHLCSRAAENQRYVIGVNSLPKQMVVTEIFAPSGLSLAKASADQPELVIADIQPELFSSQDRDGLPSFLDDRRLDLYS